MTVEKTRSQIGTARICRVLSCRLAAYELGDLVSPQLSLKQLQTRLIRANRLR
jgi:hypothetical protein